MLVGVDVGTSVVKAVAFADDARVVAVARRPNTFASPQTNWAEFDMDDVWHLVTACIRELVWALPDAGAGICAIGVSGNMGGAWLIGADGKPVRSAILWNDGRAADVVNEWRSEGVFDLIFAKSCNAPAPGFTLPVMTWLARNEPATLDRAQHLLFSKDWIRFRLTGEIGTDESDASHVPGDVEARGYSQELFNAVGIPEMKPLLAPVLASGEIVGRVTATAAQATGLTAGTPVITGLADVTAMLTGAGAVTPGSATVILGTSCLNSVTTTSPVFEPHGVGLSFLIPGRRWTRTLSNQTGTLALSWFWREFMQPVRGGQRPDFAEMEEMARTSPLGANGLVFHPYLNSTGLSAPVYEPTARGRLWGLGASHTRADILRSVYEGVALSIADCFESLPASVDTVQLLGGGARSRFWAQMLADSLGRPVAVNQSEEVGALGVGLLAGVATGFWGSLEEALEVSSPRTEPFLPDLDNHERYARVLSVYQFLRRDLAAERALGGTR